MWFEWGTRLVTLLALLSVVAGLVVLALPETGEGKTLIHLDAAHSLRVADFVGAALVLAGALFIWVAVLAWQRRRLQ